MVLKIIFCLVFGYIFGCFSTGYLIGRMKKVDIRKYGSGNIGTTNALRTLGAKAGAVTLLGDAFKAVIPMLLVRFVFFANTDIAQLLSLYTGLGVVLGHNYPAWLKFKGGKGIAATGGVMMAFDLLIVPFALPLFVLIVAVTRYVSLGSLFVAVFFPVWILIRYQGNLHMLILSLVFMVLAFIKHGSNIKRLMNGTENKIGQKVKI
ncbi:MAG TPA: glycerol-3-phosphate 1-O-acyltransferase PlsY [Clostridiales bacterium]|nr:glycerol-3-phosphate 1-O-acyltransferase PlsY [Clostridiales bacterium]